MSFKLELSDIGILKNAFDSISKIVDDVTFTVDTERLRLRCLDKSHIIFITLDLKKTVFDSFECDKPDKVAIDCTQLDQILKKAKSNDLLKLEIDDDTLLITFEGDATRRFKIHFIDMEYDNPTPPKMDIPCKISIGSDLMKDYINDLEMYSDKLDFMVDEDYLKIRTEGQMGDAEISYIHGENISEYVKSGFSIPKLKDIFRASKFSKEVTLHIGDDLPLVAHFELPTEDGSLEYLLAPRLEQE